MAHLANKTYITAFAGPEVTQTSIETFEDRFAAARSWHDDFSVAVTRSFNESKVEEIADLCLRELAPESNPFHPYFFVVLDDRTNRDGSVVLHHQGDAAGNPARREELRVSPGTLPSLISILNTGMRDIPQILSNDAPSEPAELASWSYDVPIDHSNTHQTTRLPISEFAVSSGGDHIYKLSIPPQRVAAAGFPEVPIELHWFGQAGLSVLLFACWARNTPHSKFVTGQQV
ncbi:hypothetical protein HGRIS_011245 [Hohenbuehelia grisea]|uniref:Uncharacterized protein n=1 Tax=Hohenbuehelia grisea TaxID=104357 RepID=A0ABR3JUQ7_9AGAR